MKSAKTLLKKAGKAGLRESEITDKVGLEELLGSGQAVRQNGKIFWSRNLGMTVCDIVSVHRTFGFAKETEGEQEYFVPGRYFLGAMTGDRVLLAVRPGRGDSPEGQVVKILTEANSRFTGLIVLEQGELMVQPDSFAGFPMRIDRRQSAPVRVGQKVVCEIAHRGERHSAHLVRVIEAFGDAQSAVVCAKAVLSVYEATADFPPAVSTAADEAAARKIGGEELTRRTDLRDWSIFTIDGADTKDIDDAISVQKEGDCYRLGVHIADVSYYVREGSALDREAFRRGTSVYYADQVIPMLPKALSNGICSLNPKEDRLAFSCLMTVDKQGNITDYRFVKSVIRSRVKGVYDEINRLFDGDSSAELADKYAEVLPELPVMRELFELLYQARIARGTPELETVESKIVVKENRVVEIKPRTRGVSEEMIEEFMLLANRCAAHFGRTHELPFVYRVHEDPPKEKINSLRETLALLGISTEPLRGDVTADNLSSVLEEARDTPLKALVNRLVLRSMSKARYSEQPLGHYGLVLRDYAHFTSPIRRYPDLMIHRIMTDLLSGMSRDKVVQRYHKKAPEAAKQSSKTELDAVMIERACEDCYKAEYMRGHIGEVFTGVISSAAAQGLYVELPNTVEGLIRADTLPDKCRFDGVLGFRPEQSGKSYRIGDPVTVKCVGANVNAGHIDFELV